MYLKPHIWEPYNNCVIDCWIFMWIHLFPAFITHSASVPQIKYIYQYLLPELRGKTVVDVGSRTGAVLYGVGRNLMLHINIAKKT